VNEQTPSRNVVTCVAKAPTFREAFRFWLKLGFISFGGPTGQIAIMHEQLVERRKWISEDRFLHALNYCMLLPGPEAQQLATYVGWLFHKTWGGIVAGVFFVLPSVFILYGLSWIYVQFGRIPWIVAIFYGLKPAVLAIVATAVLRIAKKSLKNAVLWAFAAASFVAIHFFRVPFPLIIFTAAFAGFLYGRSRPGSSNLSAPVDRGDQNLVPPGLRSWSRAVKVAGVCVVLWWLPVLLVGGWLGWSHTVTREGLFFSKAAVVTFGGAYAVLPYVSQEAVDRHGWVTAGQMLDGLGLAETTPGPLIMVLQFVGFLGAWHHPGELHPALAGTLGALITTWTTFMPCFLSIFVGAPHIEQLRGNPKFAAALSAVTAAVVGVVFDLAVWFGASLLIPAPRTVDWYAVGVSVLAFIGMLRWRWDVVLVVLGGGALGLLHEWVASSSIPR
jgi:chromate transporter